jgi:hypothetical protein
MKYQILDTKTNIFNSSNLSIWIVNINWQGNNNLPDIEEI